MAARAPRVCFFVTAALLALAAPGWAPTPPATAAKEAAGKKDVTVTLKIADKTSGLSLEARKAVTGDSNAFDVMRHVVALTYRTDPELGPMVTGLCGVTAPKGTFWAVYVDGNFAKSGLGRLTLTKDTLIEWRIERIEEK
jgi:hypothetical protein